MIAYPFDIWSCGLESILLGNGLSVVGRSADIDQATLRAGLSKADLLVIARDLFPTPSHATPFRPLQKHFFGKIILVLEPDDEFTAEEFVRFDVDGLILSSASVADLTECINSIGRGGKWVDPGIRRLLGHTQHRATNHVELSSRELEVAKLAASGLSNKQIARVLHVSDGTIKMHMHHILSKLRFGRRVELVRSFGEQRPAGTQARTGQDARSAIPR